MGQPLQAIQHGLNLVWFASHLHGDLFDREPFTAMEPPSSCPRSGPLGSHAGAPDAQWMLAH